MPPARSIPDVLQEALVPNVWEFSVDKYQKHGENAQQIIDALNAAMDNGDRVRLHYHQEIFVALWRADTDYFITQVELLK
jgi:hypothetical protein